MLNFRCAKIQASAKSLNFVNANYTRPKVLGIDQINYGFQKHPCNNFKKLGIDLRYWYNVKC